LSKTENRVRNGKKKKKTKELENDTSQLNGCIGGDEKKKIKAERGKANPSSETQVEKASPYARKLIFVGKLKDIRRLKKFFGKGTEFFSKVEARPNLSCH